MSLKPELCALCGKTADGYGRAERGERLCHPDDPAKPDCYTLWTRDKRRRHEGGHVKVTQEQLDKALDAYRKAMMLRWIHPSQDAAARSLAMLYSAWRRQVDREKAATKGDT